MALLSGAEAAGVGVWITHNVTFWRPTWGIKQIDLFHFHSLITIIVRTKAHIGIISSFEFSLGNLVGLS